MVLHGLIGYWIHSFNFPVSICKELDRMCANFVWKGRLHAWKWESLCRPIPEGGMWLTKTQDINQTSAIKRLWNCWTSGSIWAEWMRAHYLKRNDLWEIAPSQMDSFVWKNIAAARQIASLHNVTESFQLLQLDSIPQWALHISISLDSSKITCPYLSPGWYNMVPWTYPKMVLLYP